MGQSTRYTCLIRSEAYLHPHPAHHPPRVTHFTRRGLPGPVLVEVTRPLKAVKRLVRKDEIGELEKSQHPNDYCGPIPWSPAPFLVDSITLLRSAIVPSAGGGEEGEEGAPAHLEVLWCLSRQMQARGCVQQSR